MPGNAAEADVRYDWLFAGNEAFPAMVTSIQNASVSVCLETYIFEPGNLAQRFLDALCACRRRGVQVRVLIDALGSLNLPDSFWNPLLDAGGEVRRFNPLHLNRLGIRNHRKLLVCDDRVAFVGGFNIAPDYEGDGVQRGWFDLGMRLEGLLVRELRDSFDAMFARAEFQHKRFPRLRRLANLLEPRPAPQQLLLSGPDQTFSPLKRALRRDLATASDVRIVTAYFLPTWRLRHDLTAVVKRGGRVDLLLPGKSDVVLAQLAARSLYRRFLKFGVRIFEYQPQILHAKLLVIDDIVYVGSANLDQRSLNINYELMLRFRNPAMASEARQGFDAALQHCREVTRETWRQGRGLWSRLKQRWAYFLLARIDPYIARRQWQALPD